jgi:hypothetical protein
VTPRRPLELPILRRIAALGPEGDRLSRVAAGATAYHIVCSLIRRGLVACAPGGRVAITGEGLDRIGASAAFTINRRES